MKIAFYGDSLTEGKFGVSFIDSLKGKLPVYELLNYGEGGDTVISLYHRIARMQPVEQVDFAILWIGVNDVFGRMTLLYGIINKIRKKLYTFNQAEFQSTYRAILDLLLQRSRNVITIPPLFLGENLRSDWNRRLEEMSTDIHAISDEHERVHYVNLRDAFIPELEGRQLSPYLPTSFIQHTRDKSKCSTIEAVDQRSVERGLYFTLDGVHLNSIGAEMVANLLQDAIEGFLRTT
jgi:lysophospholipase L1-like esterase